MTNNRKLASLLATPADPPQEPLDAAIEEPGNAWRQPTWRGAVGACVWLYLLAVLAVWLLIYFGGDRWWLCTVMLFGPWWIYGLPLLVLVPAAALLRRRLLLPLAASAIVLAGPIAGFRLPWGRLFAPTGPALRVLTCNVKGKCTDNKLLDELINTARPDVVALQGCWDEVRIRWPSGWHVVAEGELLIASALPFAARSGPRPRA